MYTVLNHQNKKIIIQIKRHHIYPLQSSVRILKILIMLPSSQIIYNSNNATTKQTNHQNNHSSNHSSIHSGLRRCRCRACCRSALIKKCGCRCVCRCGSIPQRSTAIHSIIPLLVHTQILCILIAQHLSSSNIGRATNAYINNISFLHKIRTVASSLRGKHTFFRLTITMTITAIL